MEFGDGLIIESHRIPWLIWIQLLITILLILILFFGFAVSYKELSPNSAPAPPATAQNAAAQIHLRDPTFSNRIIKVEDQGTRDVGTSGEATMGEEEDNNQCAETSMVMCTLQSPCNYIGLATRALFKCFGLDPTNSRHDKRDS